MTLLAAGMMRGAAVALGYGGVSGWWFVACVVGLFLVSNVCSYQIGHGDAEIKAAQRARWRDDSFEPAVAARSPEAGRPDASLTGVVATAPDPQAAGRGALNEAELRELGEKFLASMRNTPDRTCDVVHGQDQVDLAETSRPRCACGHFAATPQGVPCGWRRDPVFGWRCPHCRVDA